MSSSRGSGGAPSNPELSAHAVAVRQKVGQRLREYERAIAELKNRLEASRRQARELDQEDDEHRRLQIEVELIKSQRDEAETRWQASLGECKNLQRELRDLKREHAAAVERSRLLEQAVRREREDGDTARAEVACLEEQVRQLRWMVELVVGPDVGSGSGTH